MLVLIDLLGTLAFAISGASKAIYYKLDWLGLLVMAIVTGVGGGITRDLLLGSTPPLALQNPNYIMVCIAGAFLTLIVEKRFRFFMKLTLIIDALGLGFFTAVGASKAAQMDSSALTIVLLAMITAAGGGLIRDLLVSEIPQVLRSDFYATAALLGGLLFLALENTSYSFSTQILITTFFTFVIRIIAIRHKLHLPKTG
ncbi:MAG TPA: trimeric intracellular cation channel family protein [Fibrobacteraceae bacterium]|jgi:uncharacterized membrane protein YeiH|nr:trimeric intracellular cation channel family protein [Fibrobacter sp.]HPW94031.1 trimeric intracellular cation channel family protein [Fibrobacteraceae bacterium]HQB65761.1 trimeric intracellular cation channel family protein [Fibrobacteraceae bacterium]